ncbi:TadE/TadG family type IV pilus assembly protein [Ramlibacter sp. Leaf400]|uniref:TadE/TadG family type IV pilus assembly protein n=1 Tax=Ramlibacter sp. Leaf400 TaxID=1736365 RepID=UPI0006FA6A23|nr:TadE/TadG family type IV pilus assembly protein [Ramlibacter sp. Leaf400]KQT10584.1 pilus assembly protein TadE [Ramlibacter sp. Leaf400]
MDKPPRPRQGGTAIIEFALVLPLLVLLSMVVVELGRAMYQYNALAKSVRDAARYLSMQAPDTQVAQAKNLVVFGNLAGTGTPLVPGLDAATHVPDPTWQPAGADPVITTVTIRVSNYVFQSMFTNVFGVPFPAMQFSDIRATMRSHL